MKPTARLRLFLLGSSLLATQSAHAAGPYWWDNNGTTANFGTASGTWSSAGTVGSGSQGWAAVSTGLVAPTGTITTATTDAINFGTSLALGTGTITVSGTVNAGDITFGSASGVITLSGGTINLAAAETVTVNNTVDVINSILSGAATSFSKAGTGTLILGGLNSYTGATNITAGTLVARRASALGTGALANVSVSTNTGLTYNAASNTQLAIGGNLSITGGASTVIGTSIGTTATSAAINVAGDATTDVAAVKVNIYGVSGISHFGTGTATLITAAGGGSTLNNATYTLGNVYNNTDFTVGALSSSTNSVTVATTAATALTTAYWKGGLSGATNVLSVSNGSTQSNWVSTSGGANQALVPGSTTDVYFGNSTITTAPTATVLGSDMSIKSFRHFYNAGTFALNADGYALTIGSGGITKDAGAAAATFTAPIILGSAQTWTNNSATNLSLGATNLNGNVLTIGGTGTTTFDGSVTNVISGAGGIIKNGTGSLILDGGTSITHTFTDGIVINGGSVRVQNGTNASGRGNVTLNGGYIGARFSTTVTFAGGLGTGTTAIQILGGTSGFSGEGSSGSTFTITSAGALKWGATGVNGATGFFNPSVLLLGGDQGVNANGKGTLANSIDLNGATRTITSLQTTDGAAGSGQTISGAIVNTAGTAAGLTKTGVGNLILTAAAAYNGDTTISSAGFNATSVGLNGGSITLSGSGTIANTTGLILNGSGTLRLVNTAQVDRFANVPVTSNGGIISYENTNTAAITYSESFGALSLAKGVLNLVQTTNQSTSNGQTLTFGISGTGNLTQAGASTVTFSALVTGPQASGNKNMFKVFGAGSTANTGSATGREILGPWATTGTTAILQTDYAIYSSDYVVPVGITDSAESNWTNSAYAYTTSVGGTIALGATRTMNALRNTGATTVLTLATGVDLQTNGILNGATTLLTVNPGTGGVVTTPSGGNLYITAGSGAIDINAPVTNGGGTTNLVKSGSGTVTLKGATNTFGGTIAVNAGTLQLGNGNPGTTMSIGGGTYAGNIFIAGGSTLNEFMIGTQTFSGVISGDGNLVVGYTTLTLGNSNTYTGKTSVIPQKASGGGQLNVTSFNSVFTDAVLGTTHSASSSLGAPTTIANGTIQIGSGSAQSGATIKYTGSGETTDRIINFQYNNTGVTLTLDTSGSGGSGLLKFTSAPISNGTAGNVTLQGSTNGELAQGLPFAITNFTKSGAGTWTLGGAVGSTGILTISASGGTLALQKTTSLMGGTAANWTAAKIIVNTGGTLALNVGAADEFSNADLTTILTNLGGLGGAVASNGLLSGSKIGFDTTNAAGGTFTIANNLANSTGTGGGAIGLTKLGTGKLELTGTNAYTGATIISGGTLQIGAGGGTGSISSSSAITNNGNLTINKNTTATQGSTFGIIGVGTGAFTQAGAGTTELTAVNQYTGATNVNAGTLNVSAGNINTTSGITVAAGAKFAYNSSTALTVAPTLSGASISSRAVLGGTGPINAAVTLNNVGDTLSPGNSPGIQSYTVGQSWAAFSYDWEINDFDATTGLDAGSDFDQIAITGGLTLTGAATNSYYLNVLSLTGLVPGDAAGFSEINRSWNILSTTTGITGFNASYWNLDTTGFTNGDTGTWSLAEASGNLVLSYAAVPEPNVAALLGGLGLLALLRRRR